METLKLIGKELYLISLKTNKPYVNQIYTQKYKN